jgi:hypothetical protein
MGTDPLTFSGKNGIVYFVNCSFFMGRKLIGIDGDNPAVEQDLISRREVSDGPIDPELEHVIDAALDGLEGEEEKDRRLHEERQRVKLAVAIEETRRANEGMRKKPIEEVPVSDDLAAAIKEYKSKKED